MGEGESDGHSAAVASYFRSVIGGKVCSKRWVKEDSGESVFSGR